MFKNTNGNNKKRGGCFGCLGCLGLILIFGLLFGACSAIFGDNTETHVNTENTETAPVTEEQEEPAVTEEEPAVEEEQESEPVEPVEEEPAVKEPVVEEETEPVIEEEEPAVESVFYENCSAVRAAGAAPIRTGDPGFGDHLDRDGDGVACE